MREKGSLGQIENAIKYTKCKRTALRNFRQWLLAFNINTEDESLSFLPPKERAFLQSLRLPILDVRIRECTTLMLAYEALREKMQREAGQ